MTHYDPTIMTAATMSAEQMAERMATPAPVGQGKAGSYLVVNVPADDAQGVASWLAGVEDQGFEVIAVLAFTTNPWTKQGAQVVPEGQKPVTQIIAVKAREGSR